jgi:hypothetical protein
LTFFHEFFAEQEEQEQYDAHKTMEQERLQ